MPLRKETIITVPTVPESKSKIKFSVTFKGEWDYNRDLAEAPPFESFPVLYNLLNHGRDFDKAFENFLVNNVFDLEHTGTETTQCKIDSSPEVKKVFAALVAQEEDKKKAADKKRLVELKEETKRIKARM